MLGSTAVEARYDPTNMLPGQTLPLEAVEVVASRAMIHRQAGQPQNASHWESKCRRALMFNYNAAGPSRTRGPALKSSLWIQDTLLCQRRGSRNNYEAYRDE